MLQRMVREEEISQNHPIHHAHFFVPEWLAGRTLWIHSFSDVARLLIITLNP